MTINTTFINLQTDFGFKRLFGSKERSGILLRFINALFEGRMVITQIEFHDKEILPADADGKKIVYDVYCTTDTGHHFILEMQQYDTPNFSKRILFYTAQAIVNQGRRGGNYGIQPVYTVIITGFNLRQLSPRLVNEVILKERDSNEVYSEDMVLSFISLDKVRHKWNDCETELERILFLIKNMHTMDKNSDAYKSKEYAELFDASETSSLVAEEMVAYSQSYARMEEDRAAIAYNAELSRQKGWAEGRAEGIKEGIKEGEYNAAVSIAYSMIAMGLDDTTICKATGLENSVISALRKK